MAKAIFDSGDGLIAGGQGYGVVSMSAREFATQINTTDSDTTNGYTSSIQGRRTMEITAEIIRDSSNPGIPTNQNITVIAAFDSYTFTGTCFVVDREHTGRIGEAIMQRFRFVSTGQFTITPN